MALITKPFTFSASTTILSAQVNSDFDTLYNEINGNITDANINASAAITASKISGTACTLSGTQTVSGDKTFSGTSVFSGAATLSGNITLSGVLQGASPLTFEGATDNAFETTFAITDPTADRTITFPNKSFTVSGLEIKAGTYTGDGTDSRNITIGFSDTSITPTFVMLKRSSGVSGLWRSDAHTGDDSSYFEGSANEANVIQSFAANVFQVGDSSKSNANLATYYFVAIGQRT